MADKTPAVVPSVQMPSADLINYRFDQLDKSNAEVKLLIASLGDTFASKEEVKAGDDAAQEKIVAINKRLDNWARVLWAVVSAALLALATSIANFFIKGA